MGNFAAVLLALNVVSFLVIICCFIVHLKNHFQLKSNLCRSNAVSQSEKRSSQTKSAEKKKDSKEATNNLDISTGISSQLKHNVFWCLYSQNSHIEFYPLSTLLYLYCLIIIVLFLIAFDISVYIQPPTMNTFCPLKKNVITFMNNPLYAASILSVTKYDFIWYFFVLILLLWETLFNFYRYYDAYYMSKYLHNASKKRIFSLYIIYLTIFSTVYLIQISLHFFLGAITILIHFTYNAYCIHGFITLLHNQYEYISTVSSKGAKHYLQIINRTKKCSFITLLISDLYLLLLSGCYNSYTLTLLPIFWMILSICFTLNFAKNGLWLNNKYKMFLKFCACKQIENVNNEEIEKKPDDRNVNIKINITDTDINNINQLELKDQLPKHSQLNSNSNHSFETSVPSLISIPSIKIDITPPVSMDNINITEINKSKALHVSPEIKSSFHMPVYSNSLTPVPIPSKLIMFSHKRSFSDGIVTVPNMEKNDRSTILIDMLVNQGFYPHTFVK